MYRHITLGKILKLLYFYIKNYVSVDYPFSRNNIMMRRICEKNCRKATYIVQQVSLDRADEKFIEVRNCVRTRIKSWRR